MLSTHLAYSLLTTECFPLIAKEVLFLVSHHVIDFILERYSEVHSHFGCKKSQ